MTKAGAFAIGAVLLLGTGVLIGVLAGGGEAEVSTLEGEGFELSYPGSWEALDGVELPAAEAAGADGTQVVGVDEAEFLAAFSFEREGSTPVSEGNVMAFAPALANRFSEEAERLGGAVAAEPSAVRVGGLPALRASLTYPGEETGSERTYDVTEIFGQTRGYIIGCNYPSADPAAMREGCELALETFTAFEETG